MANDNLTDGEMRDVYRGISTAMSGIFMRGILPAAWKYGKNIRELGEDDPQLKIMAALAFAAWRLLLDVGADHIYENYPMPPGLRKYVQKHELGWPGGC